MEQDWIEYRCKSGQTFFLHNRVTGEFKWSCGLGQGTEYRIMHGCPVTFKEVSTIATQTDDNGCNNGCMSMYINTDSSHVSNTSDATLPQQQPDDSNDENTLDNEPGTVIDIIQCRSEQLQCSETIAAHQNYNHLVLKNRDSLDDKNNGHCENTFEDTDVCLPPQTVSCQSDVYVDVGFDDNSNIGESDGDYGNTSNSISNVYDRQGTVNSDFNDSSTYITSCVDNDQEEVQEICHNSTDELAIDSSSILPEKTAHNKKNNNNQHVECHVCKKVFSSIFYMKQHVVMHTGKKNFECSYCDKKFVHESTMKEHIRYHTGKNLFECSYCKRKFSRKDKLKAHTRLHTDERPFECSYCKKAFRSKESLKVHACMEFRIALNGGECPYCKKKLTSKSEISEHLLMHTSQLSFECSICKRRFSQKQNLSVHVKSHSKEESVECAICKKMFSVKGQLNRHVRTHFNVKPFECCFCKRTFCSKTILNRHKNIHTGEKPFECTLCEKKFARREYLKRHLKSHENI